MTEPMTEREKIERDRQLYGKGFGVLQDGILKHVSAKDLVVDDGGGVKTGTEWLVTFPKTMEPADP